MISTVKPSAVAVVAPKAGVFGAFKIVATCTAVLLIAHVVTTAVKLPVAFGGVVKLTVNEVVVAEVTLPTAPLLKVTVLFDGVVSNPVPAMVRVVALIARLDVLWVTVGTAGAVPLNSNAPMLGWVEERV